jgi:tRNA threonylcarbamoyladenosine biosynthesis protein TsaE
VIEAETHSVDETRELAAAIAELARPGDLVLLAGELGAGKTAFAQGFGAGLGVTERITSPTFTLASQYEGGRLVLNHLDVYRLEQLGEVQDLGLGELLDEEGVTLIEWGDAILPALPASYLEIRLTFGIADDDRAIALLPMGRRWAARTRALSTALGPWSVPPFPGTAVPPTGADDGGGRPC